MRKLWLVGTVCLALVASASLTGCVALGYSTGGGWFVWPGGFGLLFVILLVFLLLRRRR